MKIDIHHHFLPPAHVVQESRRVKKAHATPQERLANWSPQRALDTMDANGIGFAIASISTPGVWFGDAAEAAGIARDWNDYAAAQAQAHPDRFGFFATLPLPAPDYSEREIERAFGDLRADGVALFTNYDGRYPGDGAFAPVFAELNRRAAIVYVHPTFPAYGETVPGVMPHVVEFAFETVRAVISLLVSGALARYPRIRWIFSHAGGSLPILVDRLERLLETPENAGAIPNGVRAALGALYFDIAGASSNVALAALRAVVPMSQILYGSDSPFVSPQKGIATLTSATLTLQERSAIECDNALRLLPRLSGITAR
ncbi:MAG: metal-dependent hydrolase [Hyphomicrobiales bacterium]|nr:metal-dependent hydrolase [Hyphomicrobiales bacterium]